MPKKGNSYPFVQLSKSMICTLLTAMGIFSMAVHSYSAIDPTTEQEIRAVMPTEDELKKLFPWGTQRLINDKPTGQPYRYHFEIQEPSGSAELGRGYSGLAIEKYVDGKPVAGEPRRQTAKGDEFGFGIEIIKFDRSTRSWIENLRSITPEKWRENEKNSNFRKLDFVDVRIGDNSYCAVWYFNEEDVYYSDIWNTKGCRVCFIKGDFYVQVHASGADEALVGQFGHRRRGSKDLADTLQPYPTEDSVVTAEKTIAVARLIESKLRPPAYILELKADKLQYEAGEAISLYGSVKKLRDEKTGTYEPVPKAGLIMKIFVPGKKSEFYFDLTGKFSIVGDDGKFSISPVAPMNEGRGSVLAFMDQANYPGLVTTIERKVEYDVVPAPPVTGQQIEQLVTAFKQIVPSHQKETARAFAENVKQISGLIIDPTLVDPMMFGSMNNSLFGQNGFNCVGYQVKTMRFLNLLRFSSDSAQRQLLRGLEYAPVMRGIESGRAICGEHHAVVVYEHGEDWQKTGRILDPWPGQKPDVFTMKEFIGFYGTEWFDFGRWQAWPATGIWMMKEVPLLQADARIDGNQYWNLDLPALHVGYPGGENPLEGIEKADDVEFAFLCPVAPLLETTDGRQAGIDKDNRLVCDIPGAELFTYPTKEKDNGWYFSIPKQAYAISINGIGSGRFQGLIRDSGNQIHAFGTDIRAGETVRLTSTNPDARPILRLSDGSEARITTLAIDNRSLDKASAPWGTIRLPTKKYSRILKYICGLSAAALLMFIIIILIRSRKHV